MGDNERKHYLKRSVCRLEKAKQEFLINRNEENPYDQVYLDRLFVWLFLRLLVEICDDSTCVNMLERENLFQFLITEENKYDNAKESNDNAKDNLSNDTDSKMLQPMEPCVQALDQNAIISHVFLCSKRAETNHMRDTNAHLLKFCSKNLIENKTPEICLEGFNSFTLGGVQKKLIEISTTVVQVMEIFRDVETSVDVTTGSNNSQLYSQEELDWFAIEAYNRGLSLSFMGDNNAQDLLAFALNIFPKCGKEVQTYGPLMRKAYSDTMDRIAGNNIAPSTPSNIAKLFAGAP